MNWSLFSPRDSIRPPASLCSSGRWHTQATILKPEPMLQAAELASAGPWTAPTLPSAGSVAMSSPGLRCSASQLRGLK